MYEFELIVDTSSEFEQWKYEFGLIVDTSRELFKLYECI